MRSLEETFFFCQLIQLVSGGGTKIFRLLLEELSAPITFKDYMYQHQSELLDLRLTEDQNVLIANREVENMDITLLCKLIMKLFKNKLEQSQIDLVNKIKDERDKLAHSHLLEKTEVDGKTYSTRRTIIRKLLQDLYGTMKTAGVRQEMETFMDKTENTMPDIKEICETLKEWFSSSPDTENYIVRFDDILQHLKADYEEELLTVPVVRGTSWFQNNSMYQDDVNGRYRIILERFREEYDGFKPYFGQHESYDTELADIALDHLQTDNIAVLQEQMGSGKTKAAYSLSHSLTVNKVINIEKCATVNTPSEMKAVNPKDLDLLIIDGIGNNRHMTSVWEESLRYLEKLLGDSNMKIIITTRIPLNLEFTTVKGTFKLASQTVKFQGLDTCPG